MAFDFELRVGQYVSLRAKIKAIKDKQKEELKPFDDAREKLEAALLAALQSTGQESARTKAGTVHKIIKKSATLADPDAFINFCIESGNLQLMDRKANAPAVKEYMDETKALVPGVNYTETVEVGIRAPSKASA